MLKKVLKTVAAIAVLVVVLGLVAYIATGAQGPAADSPSAAWLEPGPYAVATQELLLVDSTRPTARNRDVPENRIADSPAHSGIQMTSMDRIR